MAEPQTTGWRPITTAPEDQRSILAANEASGIMAVCHRVRAGTSPVYKRHADDDGWRPTHWMPLPLPPEKPHA